MNTPHDFDVHPEHAESYLLALGLRKARILGVPERDIEDCALVFQEHMLTNEAWGLWKSAEFSDSFATRCAINSVHDYVSSLAGVGSHEMPEKFFDEIAARASAQPGPQAEMLHKEFRNAVVYAFKALAHSQKVVVNLRFEEQLSFPEIGERMGIREEAAQKRLRRALDAMRSSLERIGFTSDDTMSWSEE